MSSPVYDLTQSDWGCPKCQFINMGTVQVCHRCKTPKTHTGSLHQRAPSYAKHHYKMIQIPPGIIVQGGRNYRGNEAAAYLEQIVNEWAAQGWEFYRVDQIGVQVTAGCLAALFGQGPSNQIYYVITFRREIA